MSLIYFEDIHKETAWSFLARRYFEENGVNVPSMPSIITTFVYPFVSWGRWVTECVCGNAVNTPRNFNYFLCYTRGCDDRGIWKSVIFPTDRQSIEVLLERRPETRPHIASHRNWSVGDTIEDIQRENRARGLRDDIPGR